MKIPTLKQPTKKSCGTTALKMVLSFWGKEISVRELNKEVGGMKSYGTKTTDLAKCAQKYGFKVDCFSYAAKMRSKIAKRKKPGKTLIIKYLSKDIPVIACVRSWLFFNKDKPSSNGHFVVLTGFKDGKFSYNDPWTGKKHRMKEEEFLFAWHNNVLDSSAYMLVVTKGVR